MGAGPAEILRCAPRLALLNKLMLFSKLFDYQFFSFTLQGQKPKGQICNNLNSESREKIAFYICVCRVKRGVRFASVFSFPANGVKCGVLPWVASVYGASARH